MSDEIVEVVRSIYGPWARGDFSSTEWAHPEIEFTIADGPAPDSSTGLAAMAEAYRRGWLSAWEEFRVEPEEYRKLDDERVLVLSHFHGHGKTSGLDVGRISTKGAELFHVRGGLVTRLVIWAEREDAFAELGLQEYAMSEENVAVARRVIEALDNGDLAGAMKEAAADFVFDFSRSISPERGVYGRDDLPRLVETFFGDWESQRYEPGDFIEAGNRLITPMKTHLRGRDGIEVETRFAWLWWFHDGRIQRITFFQDADEALEAAGLSE
jgi:ketosteroid isomerase-like protein